MERNNVTEEVKLARLQRSAQLTYREARAILCNGKAEAEALAEEFDITINAVYNLQRRAKNKIGYTGHTVGEICHNDLGIIFCGPDE
jgi:DNA-binding CsgD family transcriptional regulator